MSDGSPDADPTCDRCDRLETLLTEQYLDRLEALDEETKRLFDSFAEPDADAIAAPDAAPFDARTRAQARRHLREARAQLHPVMIAVRAHLEADLDPASSGGGGGDDDGDAPEPL